MPLTDEEKRKRNTEWCKRSVLKVYGSYHNYYLLKVKSYSQHYYQTHKDSINLKHKLYIQKNRKKVSDKQKIYNHKHPEKMKAYYQKNREKIIARTKRYTQLHPEKLKIWLQTRYKKLKEQRLLKRMTLVQNNLI